MLVIRRILLPVDFSDVSEDAAIMVPESGLWLVDTLKESERMLRDFMREETRDLKVRRIVERGDAAHVIVSCASRTETNLIVLGTRGHRAFRRFLLGSVSAKVLHDADCPILTLAHAPERKCPFQGHSQDFVCH